MLSLPEDLNRTCIHHLQEVLTPDSAGPLAQSCCQNVVTLAFSGSILRGVCQSASGPESWHFMEFTELVVQLLCACWLPNVCFMVEFSVSLAFIVKYHLVVTLRRQTRTPSLPLPHAQRPMRPHTDVHVPQLKEALRSSKAWTKLESSAKNFVAGVLYFYDPLWFQVLVLQQETLLQEGTLVLLLEGFLELTKWDRLSKGCDFKECTLPFQEPFVKICLRLCPKVYA